MSGADPLVDCARVFLDAVMPLLKERCHDAGDEPFELTGFPVWVLEGDFGPLMRRYRAHPMILSADRQCAVRVLGEVRQAGMNELSDLDHALTSDNVIGQRIGGDSVVSLGAGGAAWQAPSLVLLLVEQAIDRTGGFHIAEPVRDELTARWAAALRRPSDLIRVVLTLREFDSPVPSIPLAPGLEIIKLSHDEVAAALSLGGGLRSIFIDERIVSETFGVRTSFESSLFIDQISPTDSEREQARREQAERLVERVLLALQVFKAGLVSASDMFQYTVNWWGETSPVQGNIGSEFGWHTAQPYVLEGDEVDRFRDFWEEFESAREHSVIASALRRFAYAAERPRPEDEIVDLMIAAESLFLSQMGKRDRGELRFRLATRVASLLGTTLDERLLIWRFMRAAYDARSVIVHGGTPAENDLPDLNGDLVRIDVFADQLEAVLRRALQKSIQDVASGRSFPPDWEALLFAGPPA
jgi:hypothetical protein